MERSRRILLVGKLVIAGGLLLCIARSPSARAESLDEQLRAKTAASKSDARTRKVMEDAIEALRKSKLTARAKKVGDPFPSFTLKDSHGEELRLQALLKQGPVIVTFYRGSWCPYCTIQLTEYQKHLQEWEGLGAKLVALSPELPEHSREFSQKRALSFELLFDQDNAIAAEAGLVFGVKGDLRQVYEKFGLDLEKSQGNSAWRLPVAATYVVGRDGKVKFAFVDVDYKKRAEPAAITDSLKSLSGR